MNRFFPFTCLVLLTASLHAAPVVPGYERLKQAGDALAPAALLSNLRCAACHTGNLPQPSTLVTVSPASGGDAGKGKQLYETIGCIACHPSDPRTAGDATSIPVASANLTGHFPRVPMSDAEAADLAAFLTANHSAVQKPAIPAAQAEKKPITDVTRGCLADQPTAPAIDFGLSASQRDELRATLTSFDPGKLSDADRLKLKMASLNCFACHERDKLGGVESAKREHFKSVGEIDLGDEGQLPPRLTGVGAKLQTAAIVKIISGHGAVRSYMATRMPDFGEANAKELAAAFEKIDLATAWKPVERSGRNPMGRQLVGTTGYGCIVCHDLNGHKSLGVPAIDLAHAPERLRVEWFHAYLRDPAAYRPGTRMPSFWPNGVPANSSGKSKKPNPKATEQQIDSIWVYLNEVKQTRLPEGMEPKGSFEIKPVNEPVIFRSFIEGAGVAGIAVGFPPGSGGGLNVAFDAEQCRWAIAWKGRFIDAESTWDMRANPPAKPLGEAVVEFPTGAPFSAPGSFRGFTLDKQRVPTFHYEVDGATVDDRMEPTADGALRRTIVVHATKPLLFRVPTGGNMQVKLIEPSAAGSEITVSGEMKIVLEMRW
jgi:cytochrome c551/c552